jgi:exosome complex RNA-binding protein Rrp42 (RNase PH superfamily)
MEIPENPQLINLSILHLPLSVTFGLFDINKKYLVDPSLLEEKICEGFIIISANKFNELCYIHTYSAVKVDREIVDE